MDVGEFVFCVVLNMMSGLEIGVMLCGIFCVSVTRKKSYLILGVVLSIVFCAGGDWKRYEEGWILILGQMLLLAIWMSWTEGQWFRRFAIYICSVMYLGFPYLCINLFFSAISGNSVGKLENSTFYYFVRGMLTIAIMSILAERLRKTSGYKEIVSRLPTRYFWIASVCVFTASFVQAFVEEISAGYENVGLANAVAVCTIIINIVFYVFGIGIVVLDVFRKKYREESILKEQYLQIAKNYVKTVRNNAKETRKMRHDMKNHMNILSYHLEQGENQKALTYLSEIQSHMDQSIKKTVSVNHEIVDAILSQMQSESERQKIRWEIEGSLPADLPVGDFDLCTIFSNLLSNSIEACTNVEESERSIYLAIRRLGEQLVIEVENSSSQSVEVGKLGNMTSKKDVKNHGYGILNIKDAVRKNHGEILFESLEGRFAVRIIFPLSEKATVYF